MMRLAFILNFSIIVAAQADYHATESIVFANHNNYLSQPLVVEGDNCRFFYLEGPYTFDAAKYACEKQYNSTMAMVKSKEDQRSIIALIDLVRKTTQIKEVFAWFGLVRTARGADTFQWVDGTPLKLPSYWNIDQPNNSDGIQDCAFYDIDYYWKDDNCNLTKYNYGARGFPLGAICSSVYDTPSTPVLPTTTTPVFSSSNYFYIEGPFTFDGAKDACEKQNNSTMAMVKSAADQRSIMALLDSVKKAHQVKDVFVWLGLVRSAHEADTFQWVDGTPLALPTYWMLDQPNNKDGNENCIQYDVDYYWQDNNCKRSLVYTDRSYFLDAICYKMYDTPTTTAQTPAFSTSKYFYLEGPYTFDGAKDACKKQGDSQLAMIKSAADQRSIIALIDSVREAYQVKNVFAWFGLVRIANRTDDAFQWVDGTPLTLPTYWNLDQPNNWDGNEKCVHYDVDYYWQDNNCKRVMVYSDRTHFLGAICFRTYDHQTTTALSTTSTPAFLTLKHFYLEGPFTFDSAKDACEKKYNSTLAMVKSEDDQQSIMELIDSVNESAVFAWFGLVRTAESFKWVDGTPLTLPTYWMRHQPDNHDGYENCVHYDTNYTWTDNNCKRNMVFSDRHYYIGAICCTQKAPVNIGAIIGPVTVGCVIIIGASVFAFCFIRRRRSKAKKHSSDKHRRRSSKTSANKPTVRLRNGMEMVEIELASGRARQSSATESSISSFESTDVKLSSVKIIRPLGAGGFGETVLARRIDDGVEVVIKSIDLSRLQRGADHTLERLARREAVAMSRFEGHPNIVKLLHSFEEHGHIYLFLEYCEGGDLDKAITLRRKSGAGPLPELLITDWLDQLAEALKFVHDKRLFHRDIKSQNVFLTQGGRIIKLGDFGIAKATPSNNATSVPGDEGFQSSEGTGIVGTITHMAPEYILGERYTEKCEVFSLGVVLYHMAALKLPFVGELMVHVIFQITNNRRDPIPPYLSPDLCSLVDDMLAPDPANRPTMAEVVTLSWMLKRLTHRLTRSIEIVRTVVEEEDDRDKEDKANN